MQRKPPPKSGDQALKDALLDMGKQKKQSDRRAARAKGKWSAKWTDGLLKKILILAVVLLVIVLADGVRREGGEFKATLVSKTGNVTVARAAGGGGALNTADTLEDGDTVKTGANTTATLTFPDGSAVLLEPNTEFEVRLLDFARGGKRDRSFLVKSGAAVARVGEYFGVGSEATVCTPTAVAAVRGTAFRVAYQPAGEKGARGYTSVEVVEGTVAFKTPLGETAQRAGSTGQAAGYQLAGQGGLDPYARNRMNNQVAQLRQHEEEPSGLKDLEWNLTNLFDPVLQLLGICPGGWGYNSIDAARRTAAQKSLVRVQQQIESLNEPPKFVNPTTLEEFGFNEKERRQIVSTFAGGMIDSYKAEQDRYTLLARARDKKRTVWELTESGVVRK
ncbi:MAG: FecR domain-containing protein [Fimbriimonadaceae bacterium]|nr:FecR domain-containing protein [Fimbriimonadaceae bacterium]